MSVGLASALGLAVYMLLFIGVAVGRTDRAIYRARLRQLVRRRDDAGHAPERRAVSNALAGGR